MPGSLASLSAQLASGLPVNRLWLPCFSTIRPSCTLTPVQRPCLLLSAQHWQQQNCRRWAPLPLALGASSTLLCSTCKLCHGIIIATNIYSIIICLYILPLPGSLDRANNPTCLGVFSAQLILTVNCIDVLDSCISISSLMVILSDHVQSIQGVVWHFFTPLL